MDGQHALLAPSFAPVWSHCSGAVMAAQQYPNLPTQATREGDAAHWVASECLTTFAKSDRAVMCSEWIGKLAPNGVIVDQDMTDSAQVYVTDVLTVANQYGALRGMLVEQRVNMNGIHSQNWGTLDCCIPVLDQGVIYVWDFKHGHDYVDVYENFQLIDYVFGIAELFGINGHQEQYIRIVMRVAQPRCYQASGPVREWSVTLAELRAHFNRLRDQANAALTNPTFTSGAHCRRCPALLNCDAAKLSTYSIFEYANRAPQLDTYSSAALSLEYQIVEKAQLVIKERLKAIHDEIEHRVSQGDKDTGYTVQTNYGRLNWDKEAAQVLALGSMFGLDLAKHDVITPTQAVDRCPVTVKETFEQEVKKIASRKPSGIKLVKQSESIGARAFGKSK